MENNSLKDRCRVATQDEGDRFVGVKADTEGALVFFPLGYQLPKTDHEIRNDIVNLFNVLSEFKEKNDNIISIKTFKSTHHVEFPLGAYFEIISYYLNNGYYVEKETSFKNGNNGKIDWNKTIKTQKPFLQENHNNSFYSPVYISYVVQDSTPNINNEITYIHQHCVYESFEKLGWLFTSFLPKKPLGELNSKKFIIILRDKLNHTNNDVKKRLFQSMIDMLEYMDANENKKEFHFGTDNFEYVWEKLIEKMFGIPNKEEYFPRSKWYLRFDDFKERYPLQPDTIMIYGDDVYILDAKFYKYGKTKKPSDLPSSSSITKQITYGEFIDFEKNGEFNSIYNAFLMPYNSHDNPFEFKEPFANIGEAVSEWKNNDKKYEHIQGILVDVRYLMYNYLGSNNHNKKELSTFIQQSYDENRKLYKK